MSLRAFRVSALAATLSLSLGACMEDSVDERALSCDLPYNGGELQGEWTLRAQGSRTDCNNRRLEGDLSIETPVAFDVLSEAQPTVGEATGPEPSSEADAFVERIERADYVLSLGSSAPADLALEGEIAGACVSFTLTETIAGSSEWPAGTLRYRFAGYITDYDTVEGDFEGEGPEDCLSTGSFELSVR